MRFERILVPTDLTSFTDTAMAHAALFQRTLGSAVTLMHADEVSWFTAERRIGYYIDNVPEGKYGLQQKLSEFGRRYAIHGEPVDTRFVDDQPAHAIVKTAEEIDADLIVMGTHARHGVTRAFLGSVTERVLHETSRSVLTVRPGAVPAPQMRSVLCPIERRELADVTLEKAALIAHAFGAQLIVKKIKDREDISRTAETIGASLIVIGSDRGTTHVVRTATRPVLTVNRKAFAEKREAA